MKKKWYYSMLLSYLPLFFLVVTILFLLFFQMAGELSSKQAYKANEVFARFVMNSTDTLLSNIEQTVIYEVMKEDAFEQFFSLLYGKNPLFVYHASKEIYNMALSNPYIDSVYLYRKGDEMILSESRLVPVQRFGDEAFIASLLKDSKNFVSWSDPRYYNEFSGGDDNRNRVVSLAKPYPLLSEPQGWIIVNVNAASLQKLAESYATDLGYIYLYDRTGLPFYNAPSVEKNALNSTSVSSYTGWELRSGLMTDELLRGIVGISNIWVTMGLITVAAGGVVLIVVTRRNYKPVQHIIARIHSYTSNHTDTGNELKSSEFDFITSALEDLIDQTASYQQKHKEALVYKRQHIFSELLKGQTNDSLADISFLQASKQRKMVILVEIDDYCDFIDRYNHRDRYLLKFALQRGSIEIAQQNRIDIWCEWISDHQLGAIVSSMNTFSYSNIGNEEVDFGNALCEWVRKHLHFTVTVAMGIRVRLLPDIPFSFRSADEALQLKITLGGNRVIFSSGVDERPKSDVPGSLTSIRKAARLFRYHDKSWRAVMDGVFEKFKTHRFAKEDINNLLNDFNCELYREMIELPQEFHKLWTNVIMELSAILERCDTIDCIADGYREILEKTEAVMDGMYRQSDVLETASRMKAVIEMEYANQELSLNFISDRFGINIKNLSRIFKEAFEVNFIDYLTDIRIEHAKCLLHQTKQSVQEIARLVGYMHTVSFIRAFKKREGVTPGKYRNLNDKDKEWSENNVYWNEKRI